jgi:hypothetical protein
MFAAVDEDTNVLEESADVTGAGEAGPGVVYSRQQGARSRFLPFEGLFR